MLDFKIIDTPDYNEKIAVFGGFKEVPSMYLFAKNPLYFTFQREDFRPALIFTPAGGFYVREKNGKIQVRLRVTKAFDFSDFDFIYNILIEGQDVFLNGSIYNGNAEILEISEITTGVTAKYFDLTLNKNYIGDDLTLIINIPQLDTYNVKFKFTDKQGNTQYTTDLQAFTNGILRINFASFATKYFDLSNNWQYDITNFCDAGVCVDLDIQAIINYKGITEEKTKDVGKYTFIAGTNESVNMYKSSAYLYKMFKDRHAKFLTKFSKFRVWKNYPADCSAIFDEANITNLNRVFKGETTKENALTKYTHIYGDNNTHRINLTDINENGAIFCGYKLQGSPDANESNFYVDVDYVNCNYVDPCITPTSYVERTETKQLEYITKCVDYPIYLKWRNELGGVDYWLFNCRYQEQYNLFESVIMEQPEYDLSNDGGRLRMLNKKVSKAITVQENVSKKDKEGFVSLLKSKHIEVYRGKQNNLHKWQEVVLSDMQLNFNAFNEQYELRFVLNFGELYL